MRYSGPAIALHWIIFALVSCGWALGEYVSGLSFSPQKLRYISWHKWIGVTVFAFGLMRLAWRIYRPPPPLSASLSLLERRAAAAVHTLFYVLLLAIPITGWLYSSAAGVPTVWLGLVQLPDLLQRNKPVAEALRQVHSSLNWALLVLVAGHVSFALKHHFIDRNEALSRMLPLLKPRSR